MNSTSHFWPLLVFTFVGYGQVGLVDGSRMVGASFSTIGTEGVKLSQLTPIGYEDVDFFKGIMQRGVNGQFRITILAPNGASAYDENNVEKYYKFYRKYTLGASGGWEAKGYWKNVNDEVVGGDPDVFDDVTADIVFKNGEALWFDVDADAFDEGDEQYSLQSTGEALLDSAAVELVDGSRGICATLSAPVMLSKIRPIGYEDVDFFKGIMQRGVNGQFRVTILAPNGASAYDENNVEKYYKFYRKYTLGSSGGWEAKGCWKNVNDEVVGGDPDVFDDVTADVRFEMGEGLWVDVDSDAFPDGDEKYYLEFPGIDDTYASDKGE